MAPFALMIAGPNGSGKSTLTRHMTAQGLDFGEYINPDDIAATLKGSYPERVAEAQREADRRRDRCLADRRSFSFETDMSHPSKLDVLDQARKLGFRTLLYFVGVDDPAINIARVTLRVTQGGHDVPTDRIVARYTRTMGSLLAAVQRVDRAFIFDNSQSVGNVPVPRLTLETAKSGTEWKLHMLPVPRWVETHLLVPLLRSSMPT